MGRWLANGERRGALAAIGPFRPNLGSSPMTAAASPTTSSRAGPPNFVQRKGSHGQAKISFGRGSRKIEISKG